MSEAQKDNILEDEDALVDVDDSSMAGEESVSLSIAKNETRVVAIFRVILFVVLVAVARSDMDRTSGWPADTPN